MGGDDTITGNGNTRASYDNATAAVTVALAAGGSGTATGDASVGSDTFLSGVTRVRGSDFGDTISGNGGNNVLEGQGGADTLTGGAGLTVLLTPRSPMASITSLTLSGHDGQGDVLTFDHQSIREWSGARRRRHRYALTRRISSQMRPEQQPPPEVFWYNTSGPYALLRRRRLRCWAAVAMAVLDNNFLLNHTDFDLI